MKVKVLSLLVPALLVAGAANAAEIYNKDGNKLDLYGKIDGLHYFSDDKSVDGDQTYMRVGVKGETQINDQLTASTTVYQCVSCEEEYERPDVMHSHKHQGAICSLCKSME